MDFRVGIGYDVHRLTAGRSLILGGVGIPFEVGLLGHSDADVLTHAIMDALLGAVGETDIGTHFPDTDPLYKDISSLALLSHVAALVAAKNYRVVNIDSVVSAERPKLRPYIEEMKMNIARSLAIDPKTVNVKATTEEGLGFVGAQEGMAARAVCLVMKE